MSETISEQDPSTASTVTSPARDAAHGKRWYGFRNLVGPSALYAVGAFVGKASKFLLIPFYVRMLTQAEVGILIFVEAVALAFSRILSFAFGQAVRRFYVEYDEERGADAFTAELFWVGVGAAVLGGGVMALAVGAWGDALTDQVGTYYLLLAVVIGALRSNFNVPLQRLIIRREPIRHTAFTVLPFLTSAALIIYLVAGRGWGVEGVFWGEIAAFGIWNIAFGAAMFTPVRPVFRWSEIRAAIAYAFPLIPHLVFTWGITFADRLILERFVSLEQLGVYGIGYQLASVLPVVSIALVNAWLPGFFRTADTEQGHQDFGRTATYVLTILAGIGLFIVTFANQIVGVLLTDAYGEAVMILRMIAVALVFHGIYLALLLPVFFRQRTLWVSIATGSAFALNIVLNLILVPRYGIVAAAWATIATYIAATLIGFWAARRSFSVALEGRRLGLVTMWTLLIGAIAWSWLPSSGVSAVALRTGAVVMYVAGLIFLPGIFTRDEKRAAMDALKRIGGRLTGARAVTTGESQ